MFNTLLLFRIETGCAIFYLFFHLQNEAGLIWKMQRRKKMEGVPCQAVL